MAVAPIWATDPTIPQPITEAATLEVPRRVAEILAAVEMAAAAAETSTTATLSAARAERGVYAA